VKDWLKRNEILSPLRKGQSGSSINTIADLLWMVFLFDCFFHPDLVNHLATCFSLRRMLPNFHTQDNTSQLRVGLPESGLQELLS
jgi:hypothetical protein